MRYNHIELLPEQAFRTLGRGKPLTLEGKRSPPPPDYKGAAEATAVGDLAAARAAAAANRVNQYSPYGSIEYSRTPSRTFDEAAYNAAMADYNRQLAEYNKRAAAQNTGLTGLTGLYGFDPLGKFLGSGSAPALSAPIAPTRDAFYRDSPDDGWAMTTKLSPEQQAIYDKNIDLTQGLLDTAGTGLDYVDRSLSTGGRLDESRLAQPSISGQAVQDAIMSRLQPQLERNQESLRTRLANQGLMEGSEAWGNAMTDQGRMENDLYIQAALEGINTGQQARAQGIQEQYASQDRPLNIINALRTGNQVSLPQFNSVPQQATTQGADLLGATTARGQFASQAAAARQASTSSALGSVASVAAAAILY